MPIPELDRYEDADLDNRYFEPIDFDARRQAEEVIEQR